MLFRQKESSPAKILYEVCANPKIGEKVFFALFNGDDSSELGVKILSDVYNFDMSKKTGHAVESFTPVLERKPVFLFTIFKKNRSLAPALLLGITNNPLMEKRTIQRIWFDLLAFSFGNSLEPYPSGEEREKFDKSILSDLYIQNSTATAENIYQAMRIGNSRWCESNVIWLGIDVLQALPEEIAAGLLYYFYQQEERTIFTKILQTRTDFPDGKLIEKLYGIDKDAAVFALQVVFKENDIVRSSYIIVHSRIPDHSLDGLSKDDIIRKILIAAELCWQSTEYYLFKESFKHAGRIESLCSGNTELLKIFLAALDKKDINVFLLAYGLFIWESFGIIKDLGWEIDEECWKNVNAFRLLIQCEFSASSEVIRFINKSQKTNEEIDLFVDVMVRVAVLKGNEYVAKLFDELAEKHEHLEHQLQSLADQIDRRKSVLSKQ